MITGSVAIEIHGLFDQLPADKAAPVVTICQSGHRGAMALMAMRMIGYTDVRSLFGGINGWLGAGFTLPK